jgi:hypothetical protein
MAFKIFSITATRITFSWLLVSPLFLGCAYELAIHPVTPPGSLLETELATNTVELDGNDVSIQIGQVKLIEGEKASPEKALVQVDFRVINDGRSPIRFMPRSLVCSLDDQAIRLWPYLTFISPPGPATEASDVDEVLILPSAAFWMVAKLRPCPPRSGCEKASDLRDAIRNISRGVTLRFQIIPSTSSKEAESLSAQFAPKTWDLWWHGIRHLLD